VDISILTLFPEIFPPIFNTSIIGRAQKKGILNITQINIRDFATDKHKSVDDRPYGGGVGMLLRVDVCDRAIQYAKDTVSCPIDKKLERIILLDPKGKSFRQSTARRYSKLSHLILVCGHYEGFDHRIYRLVDESISIGPYVLTGGELPAAIITDCVSRLVSGVLLKKEAITYESFSKKILHEYPQFTRPPVYKGMKVPSQLLSGNHKLIEEFRQKNSLLK